MRSAWLHYPYSPLDREALRADRESLGVIGVDAVALQHPDGILFISMDESELKPLYAYKGITKGKGDRVYLVDKTGRIGPEVMTEDGDNANIPRAHMKYVDDSEIITKRGCECGCHQ